MTIATIGGENLDKRGLDANICPQTPSNPVMERIGFIGLLVVCGLIAAFASFILFNARRAKEQSIRNVFILTITTLAALPFIAVRLAHSIGYSFYRTPGRDPDCGIFGVRFGLVFFLQLLAALILTGGGLMSRNTSIAKDRTERVEQLDLRMANSPLS
jgi:hypothetical protein